jgi:hypothetical protein
MEHDAAANQRRRKKKVEALLPSWLLARRKTLFGMNHDGDRVLAPPPNLQSERTLWTSFCLMWSS